MILVEIEGFKILADALMVGLKREEIRVELEPDQKPF